SFSQADCRIINKCTPSTPWSKQYSLLLEEACVMKDPFTPDKDKFLIIRSHCSLCSRAVCVGTDCCLFFSKSFCLPCVKENLKAFPFEIQDRDRRKPQQKSCKKKKNGYKA
uniref:Cysteine-rich DPF motif domain-containing protein 1 n=1 Tax=Taeniopygia guttata TaxID=59729 RepID=H0ZNH6_TAEGU